MHATGGAQAARTRETAATIDAAEASCGQVAAAERRQEGQSPAHGGGVTPPPLPIRERNTKWTRSGSSLNSTPHRAISGPDFSSATGWLRGPRRFFGATNDIACSSDHLFLPSIFQSPSPFRPRPMFRDLPAPPSLITLGSVWPKKVGRSAALPHSPNLQVIHSGLMR